MPLTKVSGEVIQRPLVITGNTSVTGILTVGIGSTTTTLDGTSSFPPIRPSLDFTFAASKTLDRRINFYRTSIGTYTDEHGIIRTATNNVPRFDHDPVTGECLGLLIEESRTNLHLHSENLSNWVAETGATISPNVYVSPDGTQNADAINGTMDGSSAYIVTTLSNATTYTFSVFLKYISGVTNIEIQIGDVPLSRSYTTFNVQTGTLVSNTGGTAIVNTIQNYGNGWYRYSITRTTTASGGAFMDINHRTSTPSTIAVWGAQIELGSFETSYIPTTSATVTRGADVASISSSNMSWFKPQEGTWAIEVNKTVGFTNIYAALFYMYPTTPNRQELWKVFESGLMRYSYFNDAGTSQVATNFSTALTPGKNKIYAAYKTDDCIVGLNGSSAGTDTSATMQTSLDPSTYMGLFSVPIGGGEFWNGHISRFTYYPKRLTNDQLQSLSRQ